MRNEAATIGACLESLARQEYPAERFEVIVADGDSNDGSAALVGDFAERFSNIRLCRNPERSTPYGLNAGIREARGDVIVILGAHAWVDPGFLRENVAALESSGADAVGGVMEAVGEDQFAAAVAVAISSRFGVGRVAFRQGKFEGFVDTAAFAAYRREVFERIGLFDEEMVRDQDDELNYRLRKNGGRIFLTPRIRTRYAARASATSLWRQYFAYGLWKVRVLQKHPFTMQPRHFVPSLSIGAGALSLAAGVVDPPTLWVAGLLACAYAVGVITASARLSGRLGRSQLLRLLVIFPILHFSYGGGFLLGLLRFLPRWWTREPDPPKLSSR